MSLIAAPRPRTGAIVPRAGLAVACLLCAVACCTLTASTAVAASATSVPIGEAPDIEWGVKQSWRTYNGPPASVSNGAGVTPGGPGGYQIGWEFDAGTYDPADGTTVLRYKGTVHWQKYPGTMFPGFKPPSYTGPMDVNILDVEISDPVITISAAGSKIVAEVSSRSLATWEIEHFASAHIAHLDPVGVSPTFAGGTTTWAGIPTASGPDAEAVFSGNYGEGTPFDVLGFSYTGPGGAPDLSEVWDAPGSSPLELESNSILTDNGINTDFNPWLLDRERRLIYFRNNVSFQAFSLDAMEPIGQPLPLQNGTPQYPSNLTFFDTETGRVFFQNNSEEMRWMTYDAGAEAWLQSGALQFPLVGEGAGLLWDAAGDRAFNFVRFKPEGVANNDYDKQQWRLNTYTEQPDGSWKRETYDVANGPLGLNRDRYPVTGIFTNAPVGMAAPDGSLVVLGTRQRSNNAAVPAPATVPGAYRIVIDEAGGTAQVEPIPGTEVTNGLDGVFSQVLAGRAGQVVLARDNSGSIPAAVQSVSFPGGGSPAVAEPLSTLPDLEADGPTSFAVDREDGTVWIGGDWSQRLTGIRDGQVVASQYFPERHPRGGPVMVGQDHAVYAQTNDGSPAGFGGSAFYGMGRFARLGVSPEVTLDPAADAVSLGAGVESAAVTFSSDATGEPAPTRQWQVKAPGATRFADIAGQTGASLTVSAERGMDGTEYRAVYKNAAGRIASDPAALGVEYAPQVAIDVANVSATEGDDAEFAVLPDANPAATVTWQRRNAEGLWLTIAVDDDNFDVNGPKLSVLDTNTAQSGLLFRAKLTNTVGTVNSRTAKLTVTPATEIPPGGLDLDNVSLEWTGNEELQGLPPAGGSNHFSAGVSGGTEATYKSVDGNAAVSQVSSTGGEALATWATRSAHVSSGGEQLVRIHGGDARIEPDGSAAVQWDGSWSVNFYGGLVPFTFTDPELVVDADGTGTLTADMSGCSSSIENPGVCTPFAAVPDVTVADFSGVEIDPTEAVEVAPDYAGVEVDGDPTKPQVKTPGWGSWPHDFVAFHVQTGLAAYWYTSGSAFDVKKAPAPFTVDFQGGPPPSGAPPQDGPGGTPPGQTPPPQSSVDRAVRFAASKRAQTLGGKRVAKLVTLSCPAGAACRVSVPRHVRVELAGQRHGLRVLAPKRIGAGRKATLRLRFSRQVIKALSKLRRPSTVKLRVRSGGQAYEIRVMLRRAGKGKVRVVHVGARRIGSGGSSGPRDITSGAISDEPPLLQRPPTAVDVSNVRLTWYPRDSWLRYASSGVAAGDGIQVGNGAAGTNSTSSACPDRKSTSDAQLPYAIDFTPKASWYDPPSGIAAIYGQGSVGFRWKAHGIDLTASDPEIEINGASSRAIFRFSGSEGTPYPNQRADLLSLDTAGRPTVTNGGETLTYDLMRGRLTANGVNVFAGFYAPPSNDEFGCVSVSFNIP